MGRFRRRPPNGLRQPAGRDRPLSRRQHPRVRGPRHGWLRGTVRVHAAGPRLRLPHEDGAGLAPGCRRRLRVHAVSPGPGW